MRRIRLGVAVLTAVIGSVWLAPALAPAAPVVASADTIELTGQLGGDGVLAISQTITFADTATSGGTLTESLPRYSEVGGLRYSYDVTDIALTTKDGPVAQPSIHQTAAATVVSFPSGLGPYTLSYTVSGATLQTVDGKISFRWIVLQGLNFDVTKITGTITAPAGAINYDCLSGVAGALRTCGSYGGGQHGSTGLSFTDTNRMAGELVQAEIVFPVGPVAATEQVRPVWTLGRAMTAGATQLGLSIGLLVVGVLAGWGWWRRAHAGGRQPAAPASFVTDESGATHFVADAGARPGLVGTLVDSSVDPADLVATMLDLAQRGHLRLDQVGPLSPCELPDWTFGRTPGVDELKGYEQALLDALTYGEVHVAHLSAAMAGSIGTVQQALYHEALSSGWFARLPGRRSRAVGLAWAGIGLAALATALLAWFTTYALIGVALVGLALGGLALAYQVPAITGRGQSVLAGLAGLGEALHTQDPTAIPLQVRSETITRVLPYAVVLGSWDRWLAALATTDPASPVDPANLVDSANLGDSASPVDPASPVVPSAPVDPAAPAGLGWYTGPAASSGWELAAALEAFITVVTGRLFTRS